MVLPYQDGDVARCFVRIPGSGSSRPDMSSFCDFSPISSIVFPFSTPRVLPSATNVLPILRPDESPPTTRPLKRSPPLISTIHNSPDHRTKIIRLGPTTRRGTPIKILPVITKPGSSPPSDLVKSLRLENDNLKMENENLKRQLSLLKQLIRNPPRLRSVLRRLEQLNQLSNE